MKQYIILVQSCTPVKCFQPIICKNEHEDTEELCAGVLFIEREDDTKNQSLNSAKKYKKIDPGKFQFHNNRVGLREAKILLFGNVHNKKD